ncbi:MAG: ThiF family adenylyltransferase [Actinomycetaceae bacterium]|nr:ThiF family adenylyltransferase [Actinomycetaceae bacterium]
MDSVPALKPVISPGPALRADQRERYARHLVLEGIGDIGQRRLLNARVLMVGAGGLGSPALLYLAAAGVGTIGIVDNDAVDLSNLQRQVIHTFRAIGEGKTSSAAARIRALNPDVDVREHPVRLNDGNVDAILGEYDLVLDGTDNLTTRYLVSDSSVRLGVPVVWASVLQWQAQVSIFWKGSRAVEHGMPGANGISLRDVFPHPAPEGIIPKTANIGIMGVLPGQVGTIMATEAIKMIVGTGNPLVGRILFLDLLNATTREIPIV